MNPVNPKKLEQSKWTAVTPRDREKHFLVTKVQYDAAGVPQACTLEAVHSHREITVDWRVLKDADDWLVGWQ